MMKQVENPTDAGMRDLAREERLALESRDRPLVCGDDGADGLERDALVELAILGFVELAHPAARDEADDAKALGDELAVDKGGPDSNGRAVLGGTFPRILRVSGNAQP